MRELAFYLVEHKQLDDTGLPISINIDNDINTNATNSLHRFSNQLIDAKNLIVLAGSGSSLTFNKSG